MALPSAPSSISLSQIQTEFGGSNPISLREYYKGGSFVSSGDNVPNVPTSGTIEFDDFWGASKAVTPPTIEVQVVGGGGGGGSTRGGGGGAGGWGEVTGLDTDNAAPGAYAVTIGAGGGPFGGFSRFEDPALGSGKRIECQGGGGGGSNGAPGNDSNSGGGGGGGPTPRNGGLGGEASFTLFGWGPATNIVKNGGSNGGFGAGPGFAPTAGGGGGGGGANGTTADNSDPYVSNEGQGRGNSSSQGNGGAGGRGRTLFNGQDGGGGGGGGAGGPAHTGGGGGIAQNPDGRAAGAFGGGNGGNTGNAGENGFRGGGGGGGAAGVGGGNGGGGIVVIRYPNIYKDATVTTGSPTFTNSGGYKIYAFPGTGTIKWW